MWDVSFLTIGAVSPVLLAGKLVDLSLLFSIIIEFCLRSSIATVSDGITASTACGIRLSEICSSSSSESFVGDRDRGGGKLFLTGMEWAENRRLYGPKVPSVVDKMGVGKPSMGATGFGVVQPCSDIRVIS